MGLALEGIDWCHIKNEYQQAGGKIPMRELASKYGVKLATMHARSHREGWATNNRVIKEAVSKAMVQVMEKAITPAQEWVQETIERGKRYRKIIDNSVAQLSPTGKHDDALIDVDEIDGYTKSELRIDDFTRRSLGLIDKPETTVNVTNSISLENYQQNLALIDKLAASGKLNSIPLDIEALEEAGLELSQKQGFTLPRSTDQAMQDLYSASEARRLDDLAKPVSEEQAGSL